MTKLIFKQKNYCIQSRLLLVVIFFMLSACGGGGGDDPTGGGSGSSGGSGGSSSGNSVLGTNLLEKDISFLSNEQILHKALLLIAGRVPTDAEYQLAKTDSGLRSALRDAMTGDGFKHFIYNTGSLWFKPKAPFNKHIYPTALGYPKYQQTIDNGKTNEVRGMNGGWAAETVELLRYITEKDKPYTEMLTANYTVTNAETGRVYDATWLEGAPTGSEPFKPARFKQTQKLPELVGKDYPHSGILTQQAWLIRFPTTETNRNRHRASNLLKQFYGFDLETIASRAVDDGNIDQFEAPLMQASACAQCHVPMDPIAGAFMNWGSYGRYWEKDNRTTFNNAIIEDVYKAQVFSAANKDKQYKAGDKWHRDSFPPGFYGKNMPGEWNGFNLGNLDKLYLEKAGWTATLNGKTIVIDTKTSQKVAGVGYNNRNSLVSGETIKMSVSDNNSSWTLMGEGSVFRGRKSPNLDIYFPTKKGRYVKIEHTITNLPSVGGLNLLAARGAVPSADNNNGAKGALQWLGREMIKDERFAPGAVRFWYKGLFLRDAFQRPRNSDAKDYEVTNAAYSHQNKIFNEIAGKFKNNNYVVRDLLVDLIMSKLFRADTPTRKLSEKEQAMLKNLGIGQLLSAEQLSYVFQSVTKGKPLFSEKYNSDMGLLYSGFDLGASSVNINQDMTSSMYSIVQHELLGHVCEDKKMASLHPQNTSIAQADPNNASLVTGIKQHIVKLHRKLLGENLALDNSEVTRTFNLYKEIYASATAQPLGNTTLCAKNDSNNPATHAWTMVALYLMGDPMFLGE